MRIFGFFRCSCRKLHGVGGLSYTSTCKCGVKLWEYRFGNHS